WFTVNNGVVWLDPTRASNKIPPPPVSIQSVSADDKGYGLDQPLSFPARTSNVQISYAAVSLLNPEAIRFRYKVREIDRDWHEAGTSTSVSYRNLPPGSYHFLVNTSDTNGLWSDNTATEEFTVLPAFYQTNWFRALCAVFLLALLWAAYQLRVRQLRREFNTAIEARVSERTRIARELHDTLLQSLQALLFQYQAARNLFAAGSERAMQVLDASLDRTEQAIAESRDAIRDIRSDIIAQNALPELLARAGSELAQSQADQDVPTFGLTVEGERRTLTPVIREETYRIALE